MRQPGEMRYLLGPFKFEADGGGIATLVPGPLWFEPAKQGRSNLVYRDSTHHIVIVPGPKDSVITRIDVSKGDMASMAVTPSGVVTVTLPPGDWTIHVKPGDRVALQGWV